MPNKARLYFVILIDSTLKFGAIAQLGERNTGSVEVSGSIPLSSTKFIRSNATQSKHALDFYTELLLTNGKAFGWFLDVCLGNAAVM